MGYCCNYDAVTTEGVSTSHRVAPCFSNVYKQLNNYKELRVYVLEKYDQAGWNGNKLMLSKEQMIEFAQYLQEAGFEFEFKTDEKISLGEGFYQQNGKTYECYSFIIPVEPNTYRGVKMLLNVIRAVYEACDGDAIYEGILEFLRQGKKKNKQVTMLERLVMASHIDTNYDDGHHWLPDSVVINLENIKEQVFNDGHPIGGHVALPTTKKITRAEAVEYLKDTKLKLHELKAKFLGNA